MVAKHYVAYHNADERGPYKGSPDGAGRFETKKRTYPQQGDILWCFEGAGSPKRYRLLKRGVVIRIQKQKSGPTLIHYQSPPGFEPTDTTRLGWFRKLIHKQGSFAFGLNPINDRSLVDRLEGHVSSAENARSSSRASIEQSVRTLLGNDINRVLHAFSDSVLTADALDPSKWGLRITVTTSC